MGSDEPWRRAVVALWVLLRTVSTRAVDERADTAAATAAQAALQQALGDESHLLLQEREGALHCNGVRLRFDIAGLPAAEAIVRLLQRRGIGELLFSAAATAAGLLAWARCHAHERPAPDADPEAELRAAAADGVHASKRAAEPVVAPVAVRRGTANTDGSQLRSVYLHHELMAAFDRSGPVSAATGHIVLQAVVEHLLSAAGTEPLMLLQQERTALPTAVHVCVLTALIARAAGAPDRLLSEIAVAGLLHDLGRQLDRSDPALAGSLWLLGRGAEDLWLRASLVARNRGQAHGRTVSELVAESSLSAACVALAVRADALLRGERLAVDEAVARLAAEAAGSAFPGELVAALAEGLAGVVV
ncbi:MAG: hypothetical protein IPK26_26235 [Planctomycetes bacterium]|nr:hypothetical protein [Planctomycetota bacterium]